MQNNVMLPLISFYFCNVWLCFWKQKLDIKSKTSTLLIDQFLLFQCYVLYLHLLCLFLCVDYLPVYTVLDSVPLRFQAAPVLAKTGERWKVRAVMGLV